MKSKKIVFVAVKYHSVQSTTIGKTEIMLAIHLSSFMYHIRTAQTGEISDIPPHKIIWDLGKNPRNKTVYT